MSGVGSARMVFVLGTGRCGSTLVHEVLARHPDVGFISNVEDRWPRATLGAPGGRLYRSLRPELSLKGRARFAPSEAYRALDVRVSPMLSAPSRDLTADDATPWLTARLRRFFDAHASAHGRPVFMHKFTGWPRVGLLKAVWPEARFVHVVRDGRAVANSLLQMPWWRGWGGPEAWSFGPLSAAYLEEWEAAGRSFVALAGLEWKLLLEAYDAAEASVPTADWLELRYEDLVADPRAAFQEMLDFSFLEWTAEFQRGFDRYVFDPDRMESYRADLGPRQVRLLDQVLGERLQRYGYRVEQRPA